MVITDGSVRKVRKRWIMKERNSGDLVMMLNIEKDGKESMIQATKPYKMWRLLYVYRFCLGLLFLIED